MISCLIVEDEIAGQTILKKKIELRYPECVVTAIIDNKNEAIDFLNNHEVDIVFLDVHIKGGSGVEVLKAIEKSDTEIIFITAHKEYAIDALNNHASYYLLKPINREAFRTGMNLVLQRIHERKANITILVPHKNAQIPIRATDITYIKSEGSYSHICVGEEQFLSSKSLRYYEELLPKNSFIRTHHSYLVNNKHVVKLHKGRSGTLIMSNGDEIPVAQRRLNDFLNIYQV